MKRLARRYTARESCCSTLWPAPHLALLLLFFLLGSVTADCECGYSTSIDGVSHVFTDLIESDFTKVRDISDDTDWRRQAFNMSSEVARGNFGEMFVVDNVDSGSAGPEKGLQLIVQGQNVEDNMVPGAEIDTERDDVLWGTFRAGLKLTSIPGTCSAFFWYYNDTAEIDMEFLSKDFDTSNNSYPVNLVLHSRQASQAGSNADNYIKTNLPFNPTTDFHEYRIDLIPGKVLFYADGQLLGQVNGSAVPTMAGHLVLQHWSNGNPLWSGGPPTTDAVLTVSYVKAYFNSSTEERNRDWAQRCRDVSAPDSVCEIPEVTASNSTAGQFFFSNENNMANNQTVFGENGGRRLECGWLATLLGMVLAFGLLLGL